MEFSVNWDAVFSGVVALSTVVYAFLTWKLVSETKSLRKAQTDPQLSISIAADRGDIDGLVELVIGNHGGGAAHNITLGFEGDPTHFSETYPIDKVAIIEHGIRYMEPHGSWRIPLGSFYHPERFEKAVKNPWVFNVRYEDSLGKVTPEIFNIDFRQLSGLWSTSSPMSKIAKDVKSMEKHINRYFPYWESSGSMGSPIEMVAS